MSTTPEVSRITTHVLDATSGRPAEGVAVELLAFDGVSWRSVDTAATDADGRVTRIGGDELPAGDYRLRFETGAWFAERGIEKRISAISGCSSSTRRPMSKSVACSAAE